MGEEEAKLSLRANQELGMCFHIRKYHFVSVGRGGGQTVPPRKSRIGYAFSHITACLHVCLFMYVCVYACMYVYMHVCMYDHAKLSLCANQELGVCFHMSDHVYMCACTLCVFMCACMYVCVYVCVRVFMCACMYVCVYVRMSRPNCPFVRINTWVCC